MANFVPCEKLGGPGNEASCGESVISYIIVVYNELSMHDNGRTAILLK